MTTTTPFATRTEVEIIADTVIALMRGNLFAATIWNKQEAARLAKITPRALMEADERWQRRRLSVPVEGRPVLAEALVVATHDEKSHLALETRRTSPSVTTVPARPYGRESNGYARGTTNDREGERGTLGARTCTDGRSGLQGELSSDTRRVQETPDRLICSRCGKQRTPDKFHGSTKVCTLCVWRRRRNRLYLKEVGAAVLEVHDELVGSACTVCGEAFQLGDKVRPVDVLLAHEGCGDLLNRPLMEGA